MTLTACGLLLEISHSIRRLPTLYAGNENLHVEAIQQRDEWAKKAIDLFA
jgi:hypothetical protein